MRPKNNIFIILTILIIIVSFYPYAGAQSDLSFKIPAPRNAKLTDTRELNLGGPRVHVTIYETNEAASMVVYYYRNFFALQGFQKISDSIDRKRKKQSLRFKKDRLIVDLMVIDKEIKREIAISRFLQAPEETSPESAGRLTANNLISALPKEDSPGEDLADLPRPPQSVRLMRRDSGAGGTTIIYSTSLGVRDIVDFYRMKMSGRRWELTNATTMGKALETYKQTSGETDLGIKSPFPDGENFQDVVSGSYILQFNSDYADAQITVFPNFLNQKLGSMVQVAYQEKE